MKPIVEGMGLKWNDQLEKMKKHPVLGPEVSPLSGIPSAGGRQTMVCLPETRLQVWMANTEIHQDADGRFSLNDLHRSAGGEDKNKPSNFLRSEQTQKLIEAINRCSDSSSGSSDR